MAVKRVKYKSHRNGTIWSDEENCYIGWKADFRFGGKRIRKMCFPTRWQAEQYEEEFKLEENFQKPKFNNNELFDFFVKVQQKEIGFKEFKETILDLSW